MQRRTFDKWAVSGVLGHKTVIESGLEYVYFVWCKVCAANKGKILKHPVVKGATKVAADTYINGTNVVTKYSVGLLITQCYQKCTSFRICLYVPK